MVFPLIFCISYLIYRKCCYNKEKDNIYDLGRDKSFKQADPEKQRRSLPGTELEKDLAETLEKFK